VRLTTKRLAVAILMLALAGCGGAQVTVNDVPGGPVALTVPGTGEGLAPQASATPGATPTATPTDASAQPTATPAAGTTGTAPSTTDTQAAPNGGAEAPATGTGDGAGTTGGQAPTPANQNELEDYCAQNPGAC
jgi:hypothetical protein